MFTSCKNKGTRIYRVSQLNGYTLTKIVLAPKKRGLNALKCYYVAEHNVRTHFYFMKKISKIFFGGEKKNSFEFWLKR